MEWNRMEWNRARPSTFPFVHSTFPFDIRPSTFNLRIRHSTFRIPHSAFRVPHWSLHDRRVVLARPRRRREVALRRDDDLIQRDAVLARLDPDPLRAARFEVHQRA